MPANRDESGRFVKGSSGNPAGRPRRTDYEIAVLDCICQLSEYALTTIESILQDKKAPAAVRLKAAEMVLERVLGKPMNLKEIDDYETTPRIEW